MKKLLILIGFFLIWLIKLVSFSFAEDALDDVLWVDSDAGNYQIINQKDDVKWLVVSQKGILGSKDKPSLIVRISKLMLKFAVIIGVIVFLVGWIRFILVFGDDNKALKIRDNLMIAIAWFLIAFGAWVILQLILSIWPSIWW